MPPRCVRGDAVVSAMNPARDAGVGTCAGCGCTDLQGSRTHAIAAALADDDLDRAMTLGLLEPVACAACSADCSARLQQARDARLRALAARDRHHARDVRLARRAAERDARRAANQQASSLPPAAAAILARAKAKAAGKA